MTEARLPAKKDVALALLAGPSVFVHLDPRKDGVVVPKWFKSQPQLVLQIGLHLAVRIPDLEVGDRGISCTLSFNRSPFWCDLPWDAIYALVGEDGRGMVWPESVPPELAQAQKPGLKAVPSKKPRRKRDPAEPAKAARVSEPRAPAPEPAPQEPATGEAPKRALPPYLRVIK